MTIENFVKDNILQINASINAFKEGNGTAFIDVDIKQYLQEKLYREIENNDFEAKLLNALKDENFVKARIVDIANNFVFYKSDLEKFYKTKIFQNVFSQINLDDLTESLITNISNNNVVDNLEIKFIKNDLKILLVKSLTVVKQGGFTGDLQHIDYGLRVANEGDSAQFFFIARAMLAGFNCSNVDVRSSRYDAIVDVNNKLLRIQVKGVTSTGNISFFDRDRGGQGIDHTHERNRGKRITSADCDIYAAVDKQVGICYLIPMHYADTLSDDSAKKVKLDNVKQYLEKWQTIIDVAKRKS
jgi:hypothetical protein